MFAPPERRLKRRPKTLRRYRNQNRPEIPSLDRRGDCAAGPDNAGEGEQRFCDLSAGFLITRLQVRFLHGAEYSLRSIKVFLRDRHSPTETECARRDLQARRSLLAFVLVQIDASLHPADCLFVKSVRNDVARTQVILDIEAQYLIENLIGRKSVLVLLIWFQLRAGRLVDCRSWNDVAVATGRVRSNGGLVAASRGIIGVDPARQFIH